MLHTTFAQQVAMMQEVDDRYERRLLDEVKKVDREISSLQDQRNALVKLLARARAERHAERDMTILRSSSIDRIAIETKILQVLEKNKKPTAAKEIYSSVLSSFPGLKESTFRSHLHRLKNKQRIHPAKRQRGFWMLKSEP